MDCRCFWVDLRYKEQDFQPGYKARVNGSSMTLVVTAPLLTMVVYIFNWG